jgi:hypothetical protein
VSVSSGFTLAGLLGGLLTDSTSADQLSSAIRDLTKFVSDDHRWVVSIQLRHNPRREDDA